MNLGRAIVFAVAAVALPLVTAAVPPGVSPGPGIRYATDAYPGFDSEDELLKLARKEPRWFGWINGPKMDSASAEFAYAVECECAEGLRRARARMADLARGGEGAEGRR